MIGVVGASSGLTFGVAGVERSEPPGPNHRGGLDGFAERALGLAMTQPQNPSGLRSNKRDLLDDLLLLRSPDTFSDKTGG